MAEHGSSARKAVMLSSDGISSLPDALLHHILSFLHMKDAVGTSVLSKRWRYLWTFNPNLNFDLDSIRGGNFNRNLWNFNRNPNFDLDMITGNLIFNVFQFNGEQVESYIPIINQCLDLYNSLNINRFVLHFPITNIDLSSHVHNWITFAITRGVRQLLLKYCLLNLPDLVFFHEPLTELALHMGNFNLPLGFKGFPFLKILDLFLVTISNDTLTTLLYTCPLLEDLSIRLLDSSSKTSLINISAPNLRLKFLKISGCPYLKKLLVNAPNLVSLSYISPIGDSNIHIENVPLLLNVHVSMFNSYEPPQVVHQWTPLVTSMANVKSLTVTSWFTQFIFSEYCLFRNTHIAFKNLKEFHWSGALACKYEVLAIATFLRDCPLLQYLSIQVSQIRCGSDMYHRYYDLVKNRIPPFQGCVGNHYLRPLDYALHHLKTINIKAFSATEMLMVLMRFLLDKATILDSVLVTSQPKDDQMPISHLQEKLSRVPKASKNAKVVIAYLSDE